LRAEDKSVNIQLHSHAQLLKHVSRSFYLTLRILPRAIRPQIGLAYLLARATDTITDTEIVPVAERLDALDQLRSRILGQSKARLDFRRFAAQSPSAGKTPALQAEAISRGDAPAAKVGHDHERILLTRIEEILAALGSLAPGDQQRIRDVLRIIISGQELDLRRFGNIPPGNILACGARPQAELGLNSPTIAESDSLPALEATALPVIALQTEHELNDYTYRVAGCVGEFWTNMCRIHLFPKAAVDDTFLLINSVRFGQGLQLVNILRDLTTDLRRGRCYVPIQRLSEHGLQPNDLLAPGNEPRFRPLYRLYLGMAWDHLAAGWAYTEALPRGCVRVRLACAWPILIGLRTLDRLRLGPVLDPEKRIKVPRAEVRQLIVRTIVLYPWPSAWRRLAQV
jgi:farnesyl-diphosphate farnesyltransferase